MYELKRKEKIVERLKVGNEVITISILPDEIAKEYIKAQTAIGQAQLAVNAAQKSSAEYGVLVEQLGNALIDLLSLLLGKVNTEKILEFYEKNYIEMINEVFPFLTYVLVPKIEKSIKNARRRRGKAYKKARGKR